MILQMRSVSYIPGLDGFRAIAVLLVLVAHFGFKNVVPGGLGVTIFFFLSGFLISSLLLKERGEQGSVSVKKFYIRRFLRLAPELFVMLAISSIYKSVMGHPPLLGEILAALTYTTNYFLHYVENVRQSGFNFSWPHLWSLSIEEHFYIIYPAIFSMYLVTVRRQYSVAVFVIFACLVYRLLLLANGLAYVESSHPYTYLASEARFDSIMYGALLAFAMHKPRPLSSPMAVWIGLGGWGLLLLSLIVRNVEFREGVRYSTQGLAMFLIFLSLYNSRAWDWLIRLLESWPMRRMGVLSYGAYLWHLEFLFVMGAGFGLTRDDLSLSGKLMFTLGGLICTFFVAEISYRFVSRPFQKLRVKFGSHAA